MNFLTRLASISPSKEDEKQEKLYLQRKKTFFCFFSCRSQNQLQEKLKFHSGKKTRWESFKGTKKGFEKYYNKKKLGTGIVYSLYNHSKFKSSSLYSRTNRKVWKINLFWLTGHVRLDTDRSTSRIYRLRRFVCWLRTNSHDWSKVFFAVLRAFCASSTESKIIRLINAQNKFSTSSRMKQT